MTKLVLSRNQIGNTGATALAEGLKHNTALTTLDLGGNNISEEAKDTIRAAWGNRGGHLYL